MIDTCMALWNLGLKGRVGRMLIALFLICMSASLLLISLGLPALSRRAFSTQAGDVQHAVHLHYAKRFLESVPATLPQAAVAPTAVPVPTVAPTIPVPSNSLQGAAVVGAQPHVPAPATGARGSVPRMHIHSAPARPKVKATPVPSATAPSQPLPAGAPVAPASPTVVPTVTIGVTPTPTVLPEVTPVPVVAPSPTPTTPTTPEPEATPVPTTPPTFTPSLTDINSPTTDATPTTAPGPTASAAGNLLSASVMPALHTALVAALYMQTASAANRSEISLLALLLFGGWMPTLTGSSGVLLGAVVPGSLLLPIVLYLGWKRRSHRHRDGSR